MDTASLLAALRRLTRAQPGPQTLHLPPGLSPQDALHAVRAAVKILEPAPATPKAPPHSGAMRVHIDGASRGNPGPAGIGVLFLGPDGSVVERVFRGIGRATNNVAEYSALLAALERAVDMDVKDLDVYSDSELLVRQMQGRYQVKHPALRPLYLAAKDHIAAFRHFTIHHVPRELNAEADTLANRGIDEAARGADRPLGSTDDGGGA